MSAPRFAELLGRSCFSFLEGASHPHELLHRAHELELDALALCDRDGLYGAARLYVAARELADAHPSARAPRILVGAELTLEPEGLPAPPAYRPGRQPSVALLAMDAHGYANLCRLLTETHATHPKGTAGIAASRVAALSRGLISILPHDPRWPLERSGLEALRQAFDERLAVAVWRHLEPHDRSRLEAALELDLPIVASARPLFHRRTKKPLADVLHCIRHGVTLDAAGAALPCNAEAELTSASALERLFPGRREWLERSVALAERCTFSLSELRYAFPSERDQAGGGPDDALRRAVDLGASERFPSGVPGDVRAQLDRELELIAELDVAPYFLSVKQIVDIARERRILCQGRGSAANSAVCYVLGITAVDPVKSALLFERFMSVARREPPDIDVDFEHERREEVIQEIYRRHGRERAAMVSELICYRGKSALREVGKVFGLATEQLDRLSHLAGYTHATEEESRREPKSRIDGAPRVAELTRDALAGRGLDPDDRRLTQVLALAEELQGVPRHLSIHVGGFVLSAEPLDHVAPIEPASMANRTVIPWDKDDIDALGFFKVDVLGLGMLTAIRKALAAVHERRHGSLEGFDPIAELARLPVEDPAVYDACCRADTIGVFQIESRAQMAMLPALRPRQFYDLVVEVGIVRPGPIQGGMVHPYLRRRTGEEAVHYPHPILETILKRTLGVPLFQEQVMQIAITAAGYLPGEADQLRRDMAAWRRNGRLKMHRDKLVAGFRAHGISDAFAESLYQQILGFGEYGFPESHAASFALLVYASAWLKVHHQAAFTAALLNSQPMGFYSPSSLVRDAQAHGVEVRPVRIEASDWDTLLEPRGPSSETQAIRLGFRQIRGLSESKVTSLLQARDEHPFASIDDVARRSGLTRPELEQLARAGAFDTLCPSRREALWQLRAPREAGLYDDVPLEPTTPVNLRPLGAPEQLALDYGTLGLSLHDHPMRHLRKELARRRVRLARDQARFRQGERVTVAGLVQSRQRPVTAKGIVFITLEDESGTVNLVVYGDVFARYELAARHAGLLLARGRVDRKGEVVHVRAEELERLDLPTGTRPLDTRSRDFH
ncbi:MAG: error-prone DNA polymerase [Deltaproteobacteria bacterium]|nr:error-prone DNA polymerase [Deltaproteobacteria bacterium]